MTLYEKETAGIRVRVEPSFSLRDSDLGDNTFVFNGGFVTLPDNYEWGEPYVSPGLLDD